MIARLHAPEPPDAPRTAWNAKPAGFRRQGCRDGIRPARLSRAAGLCSLLVVSIVGHGIDLVDCQRLRRALELHGERFLARVLTERERAYVLSKRDSVPHLAGRFAAKEAILKVLGTGWRGQIAWTDMEIVNDANGQPVVKLSGQCARIAEDKGITRILVSITHTSSHAAATAIGVREE